MQKKYNNVGENRGKGCLRGMVNTSAYRVYNGQAGQTERPEFIDSYDDHDAMNFMDWIA